jgi:hypothetical protein
VRDVVELPQGYTLAQVESMARSAAVSARTNPGESMADRIDDAWSAIVERLYADPEPIPAPMLVWEGRKALYRADRSRLSQYGCAERDIFNGLGSAPNFRTYWYHPATSFEHQIVEHRTLAQIWPKLSDQARTVLVAFAIYGSHQAAADALNMPASSFRTYVSWARRDFLKLWHAGETPSKVWGFNHPGNGGLGKHRRPSAIDGSGSDQ